ncbi:DUF2541 family protein, partial [Escherichia coli]|uniref:DUF2541 family protein n=1 Tax=Escherichia coli TaxID=562 RepID=UPI002023C312
FFFDNLYQHVEHQPYLFVTKLRCDKETGLNIPSKIKEGQTTDWININSDNDNKRCVSKITFSGHTVNSSDMATLKIIGDD